MRRAVGAVVVFEPGVTVDMVKRALEHMPGVGSIHVETFDPRAGGPVWYIP